MTSLSHVFPPQSASSAPKPSPAASAALSSSASAVDAGEAPSLLVSILPHRLQFLSIQKPAVPSLCYALLRLLLEAQDRSSFLSYTETDDKDVSLLLDASLLAEFRSSLSHLPNLSIAPPTASAGAAIQLIGYPLRAIQVLEGYSGHVDAAIISTVSTALADAGFSIFYVSTNHADYVLVREEELAAVLGCLADRFVLIKDEMEGDEDDDDDDNAARERDDERKEAEAENGSVSGRERELKVSSAPASSSLLSPDSSEWGDELRKSPRRDRRRHDSSESSEDEDRMIREAMRRSRRRHRQRTEEREGIVEGEESEQEDWSQASGTPPSAFLSSTPLDPSPAATLSSLSLAASPSFPSASGLPSASSFSARPLRLQAMPYSLVLHCFPALDTRVLTNCGLLFLDEIEALQADGTQVLFGCYDVASTELQYCEGELVYSASPPHWVDFTSEGESARWTEAHGPCGSSDERPFEHVEPSSHVSLRVTPEHRMLVQTGNADVDGQVHWSEHREQCVNQDTGAGRRGAVAETPHLKELAESLLSTDPRAHVRMLACAAAGYVPLLTITRRVVQRDLRLSDTQLGAFLELLGFWLGDGSISYRHDGSSDDAVTFHHEKQTEVHWLKELFAHVGLKACDWKSCTAGKAEHLHVLEPSWFAWFDAEFGAARNNPALYTPPSLTRSLPLPSAPPSTCDCRGSSFSSSLSSSSSMDRPPEEQTDPSMAEEDKKTLVSLVQGLPDWVLAELSRDDIRRLVNGYRRADGFCSGEGKRNIFAPSARFRDDKEIFTSSTRVRDQLMQAMLHCGYSAHSHLMYPADSVCGYCYHDQASDDTVYTASHYDSLTEEEKAGYEPIKATVDGWRVRWTEPDGDSGKGSCWPSLSRQQCIQRRPYSAADGRTWCVKVKHKDHLIIAQRAQRDSTGVVNQQSQPIIVGNSFVHTELPNYFSALLQLIFFPPRPTSSPTHSASTTTTTSPAPPPSLLSARFFSFTMIDHDYSLITTPPSAPSASFPASLLQSLQSSQPWSVIEALGVFRYDESGLVSRVSQPLSRAGLRFFYFSSWRTGFVIVHKEDEPRALEALRSQFQVVA